MQESLEQSILKDEARRSLEDKQLRQVIVTVDTIMLVIGPGLCLVVLVSGIILVNFGLSWGVLLLPLGLGITASAILGGLGSGAPYGLGRYSIVFVLRKWIQVRESEKRQEID